MLPNATLVTAKDKVHSHMHASHVHYDTMCKQSVLVHELLSQDNARSCGCSYITNNNTSNHPSTHWMVLLIHGCRDAGVSLSRWTRHTQSQSQLCCQSAPCACVGGESPRRHRENMQTPSRKAPGPGIEPTIATMSKKFGIKALNGQSDKKTALDSVIKIVHSLLVEAVKVQFEWWMCFKALQAATKHYIYNTHRFKRKLSWH